MSDFKLVSQEFKNQMEKQYDLKECTEVETYMSKYILEI